MWINNLLKNTNQIFQQNITGQSRSLAIGLLFWASHLLDFDPCAPPYSMLHMQKKDGIIIILKIYLTRPQLELHRTSNQTNASNNMRRRVDIRENKSKTRGARVDSKRVMASTLWIYLQLNILIHIWWTWRRFAVSTKQKCW